MILKTCNVCASEKPVSDFYTRKDRYVTKPRSECKTCWSSKTKSYTAANQEKMARAHKLKNIRRKYGISADEYDAMMRKQEFKCAICSTAFSGTTGPLSPCVDHNKITGKNRDLLCRHCNFAIGLAGENVSVLHRMINYIDRHEGFDV